MTVRRTRREQDLQRGPALAVGVLVAVLTVAVSSLSLKTAWDLGRHAAAFPPWFVPLFAAGMLALVSYAAFVALRVWASRRALRPSAGGLSATVWIVLSVSFLCTSAVHQFLPFRPVPLEAYATIHPVMQLNLGLTALGLVVAAALGVLYHLGMRRAAILGLFCFCFVLLVPNDDCRNPFNTWWLATVGASPLMFVPNVYASLFGVSALLGVHPRLNALAATATALSVGLLGLGHITRIIW